MCMRAALLILPAVQGGSDMCVALQLSTLAGGCISFPGQTHISQFKKAPAVATGAGVLQAAVISAPVRFGLAPAMNKPGGSCPSGANSVNRVYLSGVKIR